MVTSDFRPEVEIIWPFRACAMHPAIIIGTVRSLWMRLWGRYYIPQNAFLVVSIIIIDKVLIKVTIKLLQGHFTQLLAETL